MDYLRCGAIAAGSVMMTYAVAESLYSYKQTQDRPRVPLTGIAGFTLVTAALLGMRAPQTCD